MNKNTLEEEKYCFHFFMVFERKKKIMEVKNTSKYFSFEHFWCVCVRVQNTLLYMFDAGLFQMESPTGSQVENWFILVLCICHFRNSICFPNFPLKFHLFHSLYMSFILFYSQVYATGTGSYTKFESADFLWNFCSTFAFPPVKYNDMRKLI